MYLPKPIFISFSSLLRYGVSFGLFWCFFFLRCFTLFLALCLTCLLLFLHQDLHLFFLGSCDLFLSLPPLLVEISSPVFLIAPFSTLIRMLVWGGSSCVHLDCVSHPVHHFLQHVVVHLHQCQVEAFIPRISCLAAPLHHFKEHVSFR